MHYNGRCDILNKNPVLTESHFQFRVEVSFKTIVLDGPPGKTNYYITGENFELGEAHTYILLSGF